MMKKLRGVCLCWLAFHVAVWCAQPWLFGVWLLCALNALFCILVALHELLQLSDAKLYVAPQHGPAFCAERREWQHIHSVATVALGVHLLWVEVAGKQWIGSLPVTSIVCGAMSGYEVLVSVRWPHFRSLDPASLWKGSGPLGRVWLWKFVALIVIFLSVLFSVGPRAFDDRDDHYH